MFGFPFLASARKGLSNSAIPGGLRKSEIGDRSDPPPAMGVIRRRFFTAMLGDAGSLRRFCAIGLAAISRPFPLMFAEITKPSVRLHLIPTN